MGVVDDYYGGYENLAMWTNSDGEVDMEGAYEAANGLGPEFPGDFGYSDDEHDDFGGYQPGHPARAAAAEPVDNPTVRRMLKSVVQGRFACPALTSRPEFAAAVASHREAQANAGGAIGRVIYQRDPDEASRFADYPCTTHDFNRLAGSRNDFTHWGQDGRREEARGVKFYGFEDVKLHHRDVPGPGMRGPAMPGWCQVHGCLDVNLFFSTALLWRETGSSGVRQWDEQFVQLAFCPTVLDLPIGSQVQQGGQGGGSGGNRGGQGGPQQGGGGGGNMGRRRRRGGRNRRGRGAGGQIGGHDAR